MQGEYDLVIIGSGPAGMAAALKAMAGKIEFIVISRDEEQDFPEYVNHIPELHKYGFHSVNYSKGYELVTKFLTSVKEGIIKARRNEEVVGIEKKKGGFLVITDKKAYFAKSLIYAAGRRIKTIKAKNIEKFRGNGVSHCVFCDGPKFRAKDVVVVGGGRAGIMSALFLSRIAKKVYIVEKGAGLREEGEMEEITKTLKQNPKVEVVPNSEIAEITGSEAVSGVKIRKFGEILEIKADAIFIAAGREPNSGLVAHIAKLDESGYVKVDGKNATSCNGLFAAGDVTDMPDKWLAAAVKQGEMAMESALEHIFR